MRGREGGREGERERERERERGREGERRDHGSDDGGEDLEGGEEGAQAAGREQLKHAGRHVRTVGGIVVGVGAHPPAPQRGVKAWSHAF